MARTRLEKALVHGSPSALKLVKTLLNTPTLIYTGGQGGLPFVIPLETENHRQSASAQVSESLVIASDKKRYLTDNLAPSSWSWTLSGYIPGIAALEPTNYFTPFVTMFTEMLKLWFKNGYVLNFKDIDARVYKNCVIQSLDIDTQKDCRNKTPFSMVLKEINVLNPEEADLSLAQKAANAVTSPILGAAISGGTMLAGTMMSGSATISNVLSGIKGL